MGVVLSCFDRSTNMVQPWAKAGYTCYCVDIEHPPGETKAGNIIVVGADMLKWVPPPEPVEIAFFFPPCTNVAVSGARWFKNKGLSGLIEALELFDRSIRIAENSRAPYFIENPVSTISTYWRKPDFKFDPCDYGDPYTKKTCLWAGGGFIMPKKNPVDPVKACEQGSWIQMFGGKSERTKYYRSETPQGFAEAVYKANRNVKRRIGGV